MRIEKAVHTVRGDRKLTACVDTELPQHPEPSPHDTALQQSAVVTEGKVERAADRGVQPAVRRNMIVDGFDVAYDLNAFRVGRSAVVAQEEHEWLTEPGLDHAAVRSTVDVDACLAPGILVAELRGHGPTKGVTEHSYASHVEPSTELPGRVRRVQPSQAAEHERDVAGPPGHHPPPPPSHLAPSRHHPPS